MINSFYRNYGKRLFDISVAIVALIVLAPVLIVTTILVRVLLGSPVLFRQDRPGRGGRIFHICKFRTMTDAKDADGKLLEDHLRMPALGRFLRSSSIDELPELWNVLVGEMSLVGPRPLRSYYLTRYSPEQARRHDVTPGITGWAQVSGRNSLSWEERFELDVWYVDHVSFGLDLYILWKTVAAVFGREGINSNDGYRMPDFEGTQSTVAVRSSEASLPSPTSKPALTASETGRHSDRKVA